MISLAYARLAFRITHQATAFVAQLSRTVRFIVGHANAVIAKLHFC